MGLLMKMSEEAWRDAWVSISIAYETPKRERTESQELLARLGLCYAAAKSGMSPLLISWVIREYSGVDWCSYWFPVSVSCSHTRRHDILRATHAAMLSSLTPKEFEEMFK